MTKTFRTLIDSSTGRPLTIPVPSGRIKYRNIITRERTTRKRIHEMTAHSARRLVRAFSTKTT